MKAERPYKRKLLNFSVNRSMQLRMICWISGIVFVCLLLSSAIYFQFANQEIEASFKMFHVKARNFLDMLLPVVGISFGTSLVCGVIASLFFPKHYAGALYRIEEDLNSIVETSDLRLRIILRDGDQAGPLANQVNVLLADLQTRMAVAQQALEKLEEICAQNVGLDPADLRLICHQLQQQIGTLKT
ncbi:hypothetical protein [Geopsychrobacter electrodiphilus]|uniref:hypothetical protein n=1 Tax=Geopsychrobacter electrodiphilus TaxID=225196 RepID=UPI0003818C22|nr:hypothetical protein [Geopsychrobacter electrodiphilus]